MQAQVEYGQSVMPPPTKIPVRRWIAFAAGVVFLCLAVYAILLISHWPFTREAVVQALQEQTGEPVQIGSFRKIYFPHPGGVAENVVIGWNRDSAQPFITMQRLTILSNYAGLLAHHISSIRAEGLHIRILPGHEAKTAATPSHVGSLTSKCTIGKIIADGAQLDISAEPGNPPLVFRIPKLTLDSLADNHPLSFHALVQIPQPPADLSVDGKFGPWQNGNGGQTQLSGSYSVRNMDLGVFGGIGGMLASKGDFSGQLQHVQVQGTTDIPKFLVTRSGHPIPLDADFHAVVNGLNGDVAFDRVNAHFAKTTIVAAGKVEGESDTPGMGKTLSMQAYSNGARVQDLVRLVIREPVSPMTGAIVFRAKVTVPPEHRPFLDKVRLQGDFGIAGGRYTNPETQKQVDVLSARSRGKADQVEDQNDKRGDDSYDPGRVVSNVKGHVDLRDAVAKLTNISFDVPGASALMNGTYKLKSEQLDFTGQMHLDTKLSKATTGVKSFLLKIVQPLTSSKKEKGSDVTLKIGGTYHNPTYTVLPMANKGSTATPSKAR